MTTAKPTPVTAASLPTLPTPQASFTPAPASKAVTIQASAAPTKPGPVQAVPTPAAKAPPVTNLIAPASFVAAPTTTPTTTVDSAPAIRGDAPTTAEERNKPRQLGPINYPSTTSLKVATAIEASPLLVQDLQAAAKARNVPRIVIEVERPQTSSASASISQGHSSAIVLTKALVDEQDTSQQLDVVKPGDVAPNSLVFILGHRAHHIANPRPQLNVSATSNRDGNLVLTNDANATLKANMKEEAEAWIQGWNDMMDAARRQNRNALTPQQVAHLLMSFRYRGPLVKALDKHNAHQLEFSKTGSLDINEQNVTALVDVLSQSATPDFE